MGEGKNVIFRPPPERIPTLSLYKLFVTVVVVSVIVVVVVLLLLSLLLLLLLLLLSALMCNDRGSLGDQNQFV